MLRTSTERPEAVEAGHARVMGLDKEAIWAEMEVRAGKGRPSREHPYWTGDATRKIVDVLEGFLGKCLFPLGMTDALRHASVISAWRRPAPHRALAHRPAPPARPSPLPSRNIYLRLSRYASMHGHRRRILQGL